MPEKEYAFDLSRIFLGNLPWFYVAEVLLRTTVMYFYALLLGKRGMGSSRRSISSSCRARLSRRRSHVLP
jgi:hypothetical protein